METATDPGRVAVPGVAPARAAEWNRTEVDFPRDLCLHRLVEAQAARTPDAVAVEDDAGTLTYAELDRRAALLAARLRALGVGPEERVGIFLERSAEMAVALLAVLKTGGAYLPLDPVYPPDRIAYVLEDAGARAILTQASLADALPAHGAEVVRVDEVLPRATPHPPAPSPTRGEGGTHSSAPSRANEFAATTAQSPPARTNEADAEALPQNWGRVASLSEPGGGAPKDASSAAPEHDVVLPSPLVGEGPGVRGEALEPTVSPENAAYAIYTSGSTGKPKGVVVPHRAVVNFLATMRERPGLSADDVLLAVTTLSFDIAGLELWLPLTVGARVVVASRDTAADARLLAERADACGATVMQATPATWRMLLAAGWTGRAGLRALCGGEALDGELARRVRPLVGELWNLYGPTETTIWSTVQRVEDVASAPPVGRPVGNTRVYLLDAAGDPVPQGVEGELYIAGDGVARGYLDRPELTAERFVPEPPPGPAGARAYRTGDLARVRHDGALDCLGRIDHQVKVRGFRIELGEVEAALARLPGVRQAVVVAREDAPGEKRLVAYLLAGEDALPTVGELRAALGETLPEYMVPAAFVELDAFPLTPNGKTDRRALPAPERAARLRTGTEYVAPRTALEEVLAATWAEVLGVERVGVRESVIDLGAHSVMATQVLTRLELLKVRLPLRAVFDAPTVEELARVILAREEVPGRTETVAGILKKVKGMSAEERTALRARTGPA